MAMNEFVPMPDDAEIPPPEQGERIVLVSPRAAERVAQETEALGASVDHIFVVPGLDDDKLYVCDLRAIFQVDEPL